MEQEKTLTIPLMYVTGENAGKARVERQRATSTLTDAEHACNRLNQQLEEGREKGFWYYVRNSNSALVIACALLVFAYPSWKHARLLPWAVATIVTIATMATTHFVLKRRRLAQLEKKLVEKTKEVQSRSNYLSAFQSMPILRLLSALNRSADELNKLIKRWNDYLAKRELGFADQHPDEAKTRQTLLDAREDLVRRNRRVEYLLANQHAAPQTQPTGYIASLDDLRAAETALCETSVVPTYRVAPPEAPIVDLTKIGREISGPLADVDVEPDRLAELAEAESEAMGEAPQRGARHSLVIG